MSHCTTWPATTRSSGSCLHLQALLRVLQFPPEPLRPLDHHRNHLVYIHGQSLDIVDMRARSITIHSLTHTLPRINTVIHNLTVLLTFSGVFVLMSHDWSTVRQCTSLLDYSLPRTVPSTVFDLLLNFRIASYTFRNSCSLYKVT